MKKVLTAVAYILFVASLWAQNYYTNVPPPNFNYDPFITTSSTGSMSARLTTPIVLPIFIIFGPSPPSRVQDFLSTDPIVYRCLFTNQA